MNKIKLFAKPTRGEGGMFEIKDKKSESAFVPVSKDLENMLKAL